MRRTLWGPGNIACAIGYRFMRKAPTAYRCVMGSNVDPRLWCPRRAIKRQLLCRKHGDRSWQARQ